MTPTWMSDDGTALKAPFPWFGGKSRVAHLVWPAFGDAANYVEPFAGSLAMLLGRPTDHAGGLETVNDLDGYVANFWRAVQHDPEAVATFADWPVNEVDLEARHRWLVRQPDKDAFLTRMKTDPDHYDAKRAGWWVWGLCAWIGGGWCDGEWFKGTNESHGRGVCDDANKRPSLASGRGVHRPSADLVPWMTALARRLRGVRVCCGDWERTCTEGAMAHGDPVAVFLDPPYALDLRDFDCYREDSHGVAARCLAWCKDRDADGFRTGGRKLRIALCGYEGEHDLPGWRCVAWKATGYRHTGRGKSNRRAERIWFSPTCIEPNQGDLFA